MCLQKASPVALLFCQFDSQLFSSVKVKAFAKAEKKKEEKRRSAGWFPSVELRRKTVGDQKEHVLMKKVYLIAFISTA